MTDTYRLSVLDAASDPAHYLAAVGVVSSLGPSSRLHFVEAAPILSCDDPTDVIVAMLGAQIRHLTDPSTCPLPDTAGMRTTTPSWSALSPLVQASWDDPLLDQLLRTMDTGVVKAGKTPPDPQVMSSTLTLISGKSYLRKSLLELWPEDDRADRIDDDVRELLAGGYPGQRESGMALRFTAAEVSPRLRTGSETSHVVPLIEALALLGQTQFLPGQRRDGDRGFVWSLNPNPLPARTLIDLHETRAQPGHWPSYAADVRSIGGGTKASRIVNVHPLETT